MGCGESKHDVATGNTILRKKSNTNTNDNTNTNTNTNSNDNTNSKNSKDIETVIETNTKDNTTNSSVQQQPENVNNIEDNKDNIGGAVEADDSKDINENNAVNEGDDIEIDKEKEGGGGGGGGGGGDSVGDEKQEGERFISPDSPNHFFSSRKDEEGVEGIVSEGKSEKSDYYDSPRIAAGKEDLLNENVKAENNAVEEKEVVEETKAEKENGL